MNRYWKQTTLLLLGGTLSGTVFAAGFALNEQSASGLGQAFAGRASDAADASTVFGNPAGMSRLQSAEISGGLNLIHANTDITNAAGTFPGSNDGDMVPNVTIPYLYYVQPLPENWTFGFGVYAPFGLITDYESGFQGRYFGTKSVVKTVTAQPTLSYRFNPHWSFGGGLTYNHISGELSKHSPNPLPGGGDIGARVKGDDSAWGYNVGLLFELDEHTRAGITYHSKVDYKLEGHTDISNYPFAGDLRFNASLDLTLPDVLDFSITHEFGNGWAVHAGAARTGWSSFNELVIKNQNAPSSLATTVEPEDWNDVWSYALGVSYQLNQQWRLRAGIANDQSPIPNATRTVRIPSDDRMVYAVGTTWSPLQQLSIDLGYAYLDEPKNTVSETAAAGYSYRADYKNHAQVVGLQLNWKL